MAVKRIETSFKVPLREPIAAAGGFLTRVWEEFFRYVRNALDPLGVERTATINNLQETPEDIPGLAFSSTAVSHVLIEYLVQRVTFGILDSEGGAADEVNEAGTLQLVYKPKANAWVLSVLGTPGPQSSGVTFTVTASGQVQYTSDSKTSDSISRIVFRARTLAGKTHHYSQLGGM